MDTTWQKTVTIAMVVAFYFITSLSLVFANKLLMDSDYIDFPYPLFMTWVQLLIAEVFIIVFAILGPRIPMFSMFPPLEWDWNIAKSVCWPLTFTYVGMMAFSNVCLKYVEVTFYQVARSLSILFTVVFTLLLLRKEIQKKALVATGVVFIGFVLGSIGEVNFDWIGLIAGVVSSAFVAYYNVAIKTALTFVGDSEWRLLIYNTTMAIILFIPILIVSGEMMLPSSIPSSAVYGLLISGVLGYLINIAIFMQINYTSPVTGSISGTVKACVQTVLGWLFFQNEISPMNGIGIFIVIAGSAWYTQIKHQAMRDNDKAGVVKKEIPIMEANDNKHDEKV